MSCDAERVDPPIGAEVELELPLGWKSGYIFRGRCGAIDREYRYSVETRSGNLFNGIAPECVRPTAEGHCRRQGDEV